MPLSFLTIILVPFVLLCALLGFVTLNRYISYKERVALARLGFSPDDLKRGSEKKYGSRGVLWGGVITAMSGLALLLGLATLGTGAWLLAGLLPLFVGVGMLVIYFMTLGPAPESKTELPDAALDSEKPDLDPDLEEISFATKEASLPSAETGQESESG